MNRPGFEVALSGTLVGPVWGGGNAWLDINADLSREARRIVCDGKPSLRDVLELVIAEGAGDFVSVSLHGVVKVTQTLTKGRTSARWQRVRHFPLSMFASVADMVVNDDQFATLMEGESE